MTAKPRLQEFAEHIRALRRARDYRDWVLAGRAGPEPTPVDDSRRMFVDRRLAVDDYCLALEDALAAGFGYEDLAPSLGIKTQSLRQTMLRFEKACRAASGVAA